MDEGRILRVADHEEASRHRILGGLIGNGLHLFQRRYLPLDFYARRTFALALAFLYLHWIYKYIRRGHYLRFNEERERIEKRPERLPAKELRPRVFRFFRSFCISIFPFSLKWFEEGRSTPTLPNKKASPIRSGTLAWFAMYSSLFTLKLARQSVMEATMEAPTHTSKFGGKGQGAIFMNG